MWMPVDFDPSHDAGLCLLSALSPLTVLVLETLLRLQHSGAAHTCNRRVVQPAVHTTRDRRGGNPL